MAYILLDIIVCPDCLRKLIDNSEIKPKRVKCYDNEEVIETMDSSCA